MLAGNGVFDIISCNTITQATSMPIHQIGVLHVGLYLIAFGNGGIKPNVSTLGADQFDDSDPNERKHMSNFFNWFYFIISIGSLLSVTVFIYIQVKIILMLQVGYIEFYCSRAFACTLS